MLLELWQAWRHEHFPVGACYSVWPSSQWRNKWTWSEPRIAKTVKIRGWTSVFIFSLGSFPISFSYVRIDSHSYNLSNHLARSNSNPPGCELKTQQPMQSLQPISSVSRLTSASILLLIASNTINWIKKRWTNGLNFCLDFSCIGPLIH